MDRTEQIIKGYIAAYIDNNSVAKILNGALSDLGVGLFPLVDHITFRTTDVKKRAEEFLELGFQQDTTIGTLEFDDWWANVYRKPGLPAVFIDQGFVGERGKTSVVPQWVDRFGDKVVHHAAILVEDIETAMAALQRQGVQFSGDIVGERGSALRQIFTKADMRHGEPFTVLELTERHQGYAGFMPPQADGLMRSSATR